MVSIMEPVLGGLQPRSEAWECVNELDPGLALGERAAPLPLLAPILARRWWEGGVYDLVLSVPRLSPLWTFDKFHLAQFALGKMFSHSSQRAI